MNKKEFVTEVQSQAEYYGVIMSKVDTETLIDAVFGVIKDKVDSGDMAAWPGFGKFSLTKTNARNGRNPITGESIKIPEKRKIRFKPSSILNDFLN